MVDDLSASSLFSLEGKTAVVTGATGFIGKLITNTYAKNGARVIVLGRGDKLEAYVSQMQGEFGADKISGKNVDMEDLDRYEAVLQEIASEESELAIVVNNAHPMNQSAGFNHPEGGLDHAHREHWLKHLEGGLMWAALSTQILGRKMKERRSGSIVNIATMYSVVAPDLRMYQGTEFINPPGYAVSKSGLLGLTRYTASAWGKDGVRSNALLLGPFPNRGGDSQNSVGDGNDSFLKRLCDKTCLNRFGTPEELAGPLLFLASDASSYVTGASLAVDGGWTAI